MAGERTVRKLIIIDATGKIQEYDIDRFGKSRLTIGRSSDNDIVITNGYVSGVHGKIKLEANRVLYADLRSKNGTVLDKDGHRGLLPVNRYYELKSGNLLRIQGGAEAPELTVLILYTLERGETKEGKWTPFPINLASEIHIGRTEDNDLVLRSPAVSRHHAVIAQDNGKYILYDPGSRHGVFVNGHKVTGHYQLHEKDVIRISNHVLIYTNHYLYYKNFAQGVNIEIENLNKFVNHGKKQILNRVDCRIESNDFVAIIGGSGAGKTTLMNAISGFDKDISGEVFFSGISVRRHFDSLKSMIGYVPQEDIIYENLTLKKMLYYTAKLKMAPDTSKREIWHRIGQVLEMVELKDSENTFIRKLSGGQKKRASIAVELLADPSVFFLDEPTSGLDPGTEQKLMITLNKLSKSQGKTVVMVTHTTQSLELCDKVIFMGYGGRLCFAGTTEEAKMFFDTNNLVDIYNMISYEAGAEEWSEQFRGIMQMEPERAPEKGQPIRERHKSLGPSQLFILIRRYIELIANDLQRLLLLFAQPLLIALLLSVVANEHAFYRYEDTKSILFALSCAAIWIGLFNSIQEICKERAILKREYMGNLKLSWYIMSKFFVQTALGGIQALMMTAVFTALIGQPAEGIFFQNPFMEMFITVWLTIEASMAIGFVISSMVKNGDRAMTLAPFVLIVQLLFSGILFELSGAGSIIAYFTVSKWSVEGLGRISVLNDLPNRIQVSMPTGFEPESIFVSSPSALRLDWVILAGMMLFCAVLCTILLRSLSKDSR